MQGGDRVGLAVLQELVIEAPMVLAESMVSRIQVVVGEAQESGRREVGIHSCPQDGDPVWIRHATGYLRPETTGGSDVSGGGWMRQWPPADAQRVDLAGFYDTLAERGYDYGPVFHGLRAVWRRGAELFGEVMLPEQADPAGFAIHPALLDAALHTGLLRAGVESGAGGEVLLPFAWNEVTVHATGAGTVRVRVTPADGGGVSVEVADSSGAPVLSLGSLVSRPVSPAQLAASTGHQHRGDALFALDWITLPIGTGMATSVGIGPIPVITQAAGLTHLADQGTAEGAGGGVPPWVVLTVGTAGRGEAEPQRVRAVLGDVLGVLQEFLTDPRWRDSRLLVATHHAVMLDSTEVVDSVGVVDPVGAAVWGLVRTAQSENPGRVLLADLDLDLDLDLEASTGAVPDAASDAASGVVSGVGEVGVGSVLAGVLGGVVAVGEWQCAVRAGQVRVPRLVRAGAGEMCRGCWIRRGRERSKGWRCRRCRRWRGRWSRDRCGSRPARRGSTSVTCWRVWGSSWVRDGSAQRAPG
jgi:hypothetical protein